MKSRNEFTTNEEYNEYLRIYFAGLAIQGLLASNSGQTTKYLVKKAIESADELLKQLENK